MTPAPLLTTDDYLRTPETLRPTELIYGAVRVAESPTVRHQQAVGAFYVYLARHARERRLGDVLLSPLDVILDHARALVLQPDLMFVSHARARIVRERVMGAPDMVLEVLSPNPRIGQLQERIDWFAEYGVREIWLLHQIEERFEILSVEAGRVAARRQFDYLTPIESDVLTGFDFRVATITHE
jgi:Uma2 family endonuclease